MCVTFNYVKNINNGSGFARWSKKFADTVYVFYSKCVFVLSSGSLCLLLLYKLILVNFENGEILPSTAKSMQCALAKDSSKGYPLVALAATTDTVYTGLVNKGYPQHLMGTYIGIRNKTTNKVRCLAAQSGMNVGKFHTNLLRRCD